MADIKKIEDSDLELKAAARKIIAQFREKDIKEILTNGGEPMSKQDEDLFFGPEGPVVLGLTTVVTQCEQTAKECIDSCQSLESQKIVINSNYKTIQQLEEYRPLSDAARERLKTVFENAVKDIEAYYNERNKKLDKQSKDTLYT